MILKKNPKNPELYRFFDDKKTENLELKDFIIQRSLRILLQCPHHLTHQCVDPNGSTPIDRCVICGEEVLK